MDEAAIAAQLTRDEGTVDFKVDRDPLFENPFETNVILNVQADDGDSEVQLYRADDSAALVYEHVDTQLGRRQCRLSISGFEQFDKFHVILTWSPEEVALYVGPHPPRDGVDLRSANSTE